MKNLLKIFLFTLFTTIYLSSNGAEKPLFNGSVKQLGLKKTKFDTLIVAYTSPFAPCTTPWINFQIITDKDGKFQFSLPRYTKPSEMIISLIHNGEYNKISNSGLFFENDDNVKINIFKRLKNYGNNSLIDSVSFSGHGAAKFTTALKLYKLLNSGGFGPFRADFSKIDFEHPENFEQKVIQYQKLTETYAKRKNDIINSSAVKGNVRKMLNYEYAPIYSDWAFMMSAYYNGKYKSDAKIRKILKENFNANKERFRFKLDPLMALCPEYLWNLALRESYSMVINSDSLDVTFESLYNIFKTHYSGIIRQELIANQFLHGVGLIPEMAKSVGSWDSLMKDGQKYITLPLAKQQYDAQLRLKKGTQIFNGSFKDINDNVITLESLKGNVILIDCWYTGCSACASFYSEFHENIFPEIRGNKQFIYLSVNLDRKKDSWLKSMKANIYTSNDYLNVNSILNYRDPFMKYYEQSAAPFLLIVDKKGKIITYLVGADERTKAIINKALYASE